MKFLHTAERTLEVDIEELHNLMCDAFEETKNEKLGKAIDVLEGAIWPL
jgi:hypothetical protein